MTRPSKRSLEKMVDELAEENGTAKDGFAVVWEDPVTGEYYEDNELTRVPDNTDPVMVIVRRGEVMSREHPEEEGDP